MSWPTARFDLPLGADAPWAARHAVVPVLTAWGVHDHEAGKRVWVRLPQHS